MRHRQYDPKVSHTCAAFPTPEYLERFEALTPAAANHILTMAEGAQESRHAKDKRVLETVRTDLVKRSRRARFRIALRFGLCSSCVVCGVFLATIGYGAFGAILSLASLASFYSLSVAAEAIERARLSGADSED